MKYFLLIALLTISTVFHSSASSTIRYKKIQELIDSYENPAMYQFYFNIYRNPINRRGLIKTIKTCYILCENLGGKEFNSKILGKELPKNVGRVDILKTTLENPLGFHSARGHFKNEQEHLLRHNEQLEKYTKNPCGTKLPTDFEKIPNDFTSSVLKSLSMRESEYNAYLMTEKYPPRIPHSTFVVEQSIHKSIKTFPPCQIYYRTQTGELELTNHQRAFGKLANKPTTLYIDQKETV